MRFTLFFILFFTLNSLYSQVLQGFSGSESLGAAQNVLNAHTAAKLFLQPAVPLKNSGYYACFSSVVPAISTSLSDYQLILVKQNKLSAFKIGLVQANKAELKKQIFVLGLSNKILPEFLPKATFLEPVVTRLCVEEPIEVLFVPVVQASKA
jgi:hypothetical protein